MLLRSMDQIDRQATVQKMRDKQPFIAAFKEAKSQNNLLQIYVHFLQYLATICDYISEAYICIPFKVE